jgi:hypothetical protein
MSQREDADSSLRKDMFNSIIQTFLTPKSKSFEQGVKSASKDDVFSRSLARIDRNIRP